VVVLEAVTPLRGERERPQPDDGNFLTDARVEGFEIGAVHESRAAGIPGNLADGRRGVTGKFDERAGLGDREVVVRRAPSCRRRRDTVPRLPSRLSSSSCTRRENFLHDVERQFGDGQVPVDDKQ
jgi:hypothetical protein